MRNGDLYAATLAMLMQAFPAFENIIAELLKLGAMGVIIAYLLWERWTERKLDRKTRKEHDEKIEGNTIATNDLKNSVKELSGLIHFTLTKDGYHLPPLSRDTPPPIPKTRSSEPDTASL
jgi:hypothetical protein